MRGPFHNPGPFHRWPSSLYFTLYISLSHIHREASICKSSRSGQPHFVYEYTALRSISQVEGKYITRRCDKQRYQRNREKPRKQRNPDKEELAHLRLGKQGEGPPWLGFEDEKVYPRAASRGGRESPAFVWQEHRTCSEGEAPGEARGVQRHWAWMHGHITPCNTHYLCTSGLRPCRMSLLGETMSPGCIGFSPTYFLVNCMNKGTF